MPYLSPQKEPRSKYRYLDSNGALLKSPLWPKPSETKVSGTFLTNYKCKKYKYKYKYTSSVYFCPQYFFILNDATHNKVIMEAHAYGTWY